MKLVEHIKTFLEGRDIHQQLKDAKGLHVIGTCEECEYALGEPEQGDIYCDRHNVMYSPDFGCVHFEAKEE